MPLIKASVRRLISRQGVARLATAGRDGRPAVVPVTFVLIKDTVYHALDAKPKQVPSAQLRRVRNLLENPRSALLIDAYDEDWSRLWWVLLEGRGRLLESGSERARALGALKRKYPQYRQGWLPEGAAVIALDVDRLRQWKSGSPRQSSGSRQRSGSRRSRSAGPRNEP